MLDLSIDEAYTKVYTGADNKEMLAKNPRWGAPRAWNEAATATLLRVNGLSNCLPNVHLSTQRPVQLLVHIREIDSI